MKRKTELALKIGTAVLTAVLYAAALVDSFRYITPARPDIAPESALLSVLLSVSFLLLLLVFRKSKRMLWSCFGLSALAAVFAVLTFIGAKLYEVMIFGILLYLTSLPFAGLAYFTGGVNQPNFLFAVVVLLYLVLELFCLLKIRLAERSAKRDSVRDWKRAGAALLLICYLLSYAVNIYGYSMLSLPWQPYGLPGNSGPGQASVSVVGGDPGVIGLVFSLLFLCSYLLFLIVFIKGERGTKLLWTLSAVCAVAIGANWLPVIWGGGLPFYLPLLSVIIAPLYGLSSLFPLGEYTVSICEFCICYTAVTAFLLALTLGVLLLKKVHKTAKQP